MLCKQHHAAQTQGNCIKLGIAASTETEAASTETSRPWALWALPRDAPSASALGPSVVHLSQVYRFSATQILGSPRLHVQLQSLYPWSSVLFPWRKRHWGQGITLYKGRGEWRHKGSIRKYLEMDRKFPQSALLVGAAGHHLADLQL